ncbi:MAG: lipid-A-disaccharide synthase-related protein [Phormidesmis sp.]
MRQTFLIGFGVKPVLSLFMEACLNGSNYRLVRALMNLLCISNGHGEDVIALRILTALRQLEPSLQLSALPISGTGRIYARAGTHADIPLIGPAQTLPSGGFLNQDPKQLVRDIGGGLISLTRSQLSALKTWTQTGDHILAVGDIVPLLFAYRSGLPYHFIGTAKSEYWLRDEQGKLPPSKLWDRLEGWSGSVYLPWERWLMSRPRCRSAFVRDALTAQRLRTLGVSAIYAGNSMMDGLDPAGKLADVVAGSDLVIGLIPGSRPPEAYENWARMMTSVPAVVETFVDQRLVFLGAIAPALDLEKLGNSIANAWTISPNDKSPALYSTYQHPTYQHPTYQYPTYQYKNAQLILTTDAYNDCLAESDIAIATAGTATEQFVGLGKPAITLPGQGPQFTQSFATVQAKMLGPSVQIVNQATDVGDAIADILSNPERRQQIAKNGEQRMGTPGADKRIAVKLLDAMNNKLLN